MKNNLKGELAVMDSLDIKPNYVALGRKYGMDWQTVKKYHNGYEGRPDKRNKGSKLDEYRNEIKDKKTLYTAFFYMQYPKFLILFKCIMSL